MGLALVAPPAAGFFAATAEDVGIPDLEFVAEPDEGGAFDNTGEFHQLDRKNDPAFADALAKLAQSTKAMREKEDRHVSAR